MVNANVLRNFEDVEGTKRIVKSINVLSILCHFTIFYALCQFLMLKIKGGTSLKEERGERYGACHDFLNQSIFHVESMMKMLGFG